MHEMAVIAMKPLELKLKESLLLRCILIVVIFRVVVYRGNMLKMGQSGKKGF